MTKEQRALNDWIAGLRVGVRARDAGIVRALLAAMERGEIGMKPAKDLADDAELHALHEDLYTYSVTEDWAGVERVMEWLEGQFEVVTVDASPAQILLDSAEVLLRRPGQAHPGTQAWGGLTEAVEHAKQAMGQEARS